MHRLSSTPMQQTQDSPSPPLPGISNRQLAGGDSTDSFAGSEMLQLEQIASINLRAAALAEAAVWYDKNVLAARRVASRGHRQRHTRESQGSMKGHHVLNPVIVPLSVLDLRCNRIGTPAVAEPGRQRNIRGRLSPAEHSLITMVKSNRVLREIQLQQN